MGRNAEKVKQYWEWFVTFFLLGGGGEVKMADFRLYDTWCVNMSEEYK